MQSTTPAGACAEAAESGGVVPPGRGSLSDTEIRFQHAATIPPPPVVSNKKLG